MELKYINIYGLGVLFDESAEIKEGIVYHKGDNTAFECNWFGKINGNKTVIYNDILNGREVLVKYCKQILFAEKELELDVPILPKWRDWEVAQMVANNSKHVYSWLYKEGFKDGYNHNKARWTDEDLESAFNSGRGYGFPNDIKDLQSYMQSIQKFPKSIVMESDCGLTEASKINYEINCVDCVGSNCKYKEPKLITNSDGKLEGRIKEIKY